MSVTTISPRQLYDITRAGRSVELIDVRTPVEFREVHVSFARNVPLDQLDAASVAAGPSSTAGPLYVICQSGGRGKQACEKIRAAGYANVVNVEGGTQAWVQAALASGARSRRRFRSNGKSASRPACWFWSERC